MWSLTALIKTVFMMTRDSPCFLNDLDYPYIKDSSSLFIRNPRKDVHVFMSKGL
jgi:hypothetical protein